ncbi:MAG: 4Fe-4S binding protein [Coriobacteriaceae bacterium]|jgi:Fe-S-cluster-containing dehydrogenase component|nr:4Fe-4S binding protein [Coriobacteriaceae bacterium]
MKVFVFDYARCNGCRNCQIVCKDEHCGNEWPGYARSQPDSGQFWVRVTEKVRGSVPKVVVSYTLNMCRHCDDAPCAGICPAYAFKRRDDGLLLLDPDACNGCMLCAEACPYGAIFQNKDLSIAQKCTGCAHLLDDGWKEPRCADACPHGSLRCLDDQEARIRYPQDYEASVVKAKEHLILLNAPQPFVAGTVVDLVADEVLIGARVTLENKLDGSLQVQDTDDFGDFWFKQAEAADYQLYIEAEGYLNRSMGISTTEKDCNLGIIEMSSARFFDAEEDVTMEAALDIEAPRERKEGQSLAEGNDYYVFKNT